MVLIKNNNQKGEIVTFISIATLIGITVFIFLAAKINTNTAQKQTTVTKAAQQCQAANWDDQDAPYCDNGWKMTNDYQCCVDVPDQSWGEFRTVDQVSQSTPTIYNYDCNPDNCYQGGDDTWCNPDYSRPAGTCIKDGIDGVCCEPKPAADTSVTQENTDTSTEATQEYVDTSATQGNSDQDSEEVQQNFGCADTNIACDTSGNGCNGTIDDWCYSGGWGVCCRPYSNETSQDTSENEDQNASQDTSDQQCASLGGECKYDGWGSNIDGSNYEKLENASCGGTELIYSCYKQIESAAIYINGQDIPEGQYTTYDGLNINASLEPGAEQNYNYTESNPADITLQDKGNGIYSFNCEPGIKLGISMGREYKMLDDNGNVISTGNSFENVCQ